MAFYRQIIKTYAIYDGIYGAPKIAAELQKLKIACSVSTVSRAMRILGIKSAVSEQFKPRKSTMSLEERGQIANLIKGLKLTRINQVWTTDITYIKTKKEGFVYLISFVDLFSKKVVAWKLSRTQNAADILAVLKNAVEIRKPKPGLIIHSDKGAQMRSNDYRAYLAKKRIIASYTSLDHSCDENAAQESFHASLKKEYIYRETLLNYIEAYSCVYRYIECFYNTKRIHSSINYLTPNEFEERLNNPYIFSNLSV